MGQLGASAAVDQRLIDFAHVLRRTTFGPFPGQTERAVDAHHDVPAFIEAQLAAAPLAFVPFVEGTDLPLHGLIDIDAWQPEGDVRLFHQYNNWWLNRMRSDEAGLHEKMSWFWHTHFTTSSYKVADNNLGWRQLRTLHQHALGNFGELAKAIAVDGAMLVYLDGDGSKGAAPNENFARELMELFTLGIGHYSESDVRAAARALAGWTVNFDRSVVPSNRAVEFVPAMAYGGAVSFLGKTARMGPDAVIDVILEQPACAPFIVTKLWRFLIGGPPDQQMVTAWATSFRASGYEIKPLVSAMLRSRQFGASHRTRARTPIEWYCSVIRAAEMPIRHTAGLEELGQLPYLPPSVAGWPADDAWLSATQAHARERFLTDQQFLAVRELNSQPDLAAAVINRCALYDLTDSTRTALTTLAARLQADPSVPRSVRSTAVLACAFMSPEFALA